MHVTPNFKNKKILIADDDAYITNIMKSILEVFMVGSVVVCRSNDSALNLLKKSRFDCVFVDNMMREENGLDLARQIRSSIADNIQETPIILYSAHTGLNTVIKARDVGVTEILAKPVSPEQIMQKMFSALFKPREFIVSEQFLGPDRRRRIRQSSTKEDRRTSEEYLAENEAQSHTHGDETK